MGNSKDQELLEIFLEEATDLIASLSVIMRNWEKNLNDFVRIAELKRDLHTLKGSARMVGQMAVGTLGHEMETLSEAMVKGQVKVDQKIFDLINSGLDQIGVMVEAIRNHQPPPSPDVLIEKFHQCLSGSSSNGQKPSEANTSSVAPKPTTAGPEGSGTSPAHHAGEEIIRIRASLLETLNNLSTENNTLRVGFEQQVFSFSGYLRELKTDVRRIENQLSVMRSEIQSYAADVESFGKRAEAGVVAEVELKRYNNLEQMSSTLRETTIDVVNTLKSLNESHALMENLLLNQTRITTELQHRLSDTRLVPFDSIVPRLSRIARQVSSELNKQVNFRVLKSEGEMDRTVLEHLVPSLEHILRNAVDHGIEAVELRRKRHKPELGTIEVNFTRTGSIVAIEVKDDGGGIDPNNIRKKAIKLGLLSADQKVSDEEVIRYILEPGFSTREEVSEISGRGVGMDVVANAVKEMGGTLNILSEVGVGTRMIIRFPFTTSLNRVLLFSVEKETFGLLLSDMSGVVSLQTDEFNKIIHNEPPIFNSGDKSYHLHYLETLLENKKEVLIPDRKNFPVILIPSAEFPLALMVETVLHSRELLVQSLGAQFKLTEAASGATLLGDGRVVYVLDPEALRKKAKWFEEQKIVNVRVAKGKEADKKDKNHVMVVDDSASARAVVKRLLERHHYKVMTAKDGVDALLQLETFPADLLLIDIDMPKMDGFELATALRENKQYKHIPIVILTALANTDRRNMAKEMKLEGFIAKPYEETQLLLAVQSLIGKPS